MNEKLTGTFYFKQTTSRNLIGEFTNNESEGILTETATPTPSSTNEYEGNYDSVWLDTELHHADLSINKTGNKFKLKWSETGKPSYEGEGMLVDNILIGYYKMT
jgi:hypothetical protein